MKVFDRANVRIVRLGDSVGVYLPIEYESLSGFHASVECGSDDGRLTFIIRPEVDELIVKTVNELWRNIRLLFSEIGDIGESMPWDDAEIVWEPYGAYEHKVPLSVAEILEHHRIRTTKSLRSDKEDMRKSIHDTFTKLCELASRRLGFKSLLYSMAFGDAVANKFSLISCTYGTLDVVCEIFSEEFSKVDDDRFWPLDSVKARKAVLAGYRKIKHLEDHPETFERERARVQQKWGFPLQSH